jgi:hypothetical protein
MATLGTFEAAAREYNPNAAERDDFNFYGEKFTIYGEVPAMVELTMTAALAGKASGMDGDAAMWEALRTALTIPQHEIAGRKVPPDDSQWLRFSALATEREAPSELLTAIALNIVGAQLGRPTEQRSTSSPGPLPTSTNSSSSASLSPASPDSNPGDGA